MRLLSMEFCRIFTSAFHAPSGHPVGMKTARPRSRYAAIFTSVLSGFDLMARVPHTNFAFLEGHDVQLLRLGMLAEKYFAEDPNTCLLKLRQLTEMLGNLMKNVKAGSSRLISSELKQGKWFAWRKNYGAFAISTTHKNRVLAYILNQKQHHADGTLIDSLEQDGEE